MQKTIALANHKGGVCKTTLTLSLADAFSRLGFSVLVVDLDPQANATRLLYSFDDAPAVTVDKVLDGSASLAEAIIQNLRIDNVHLIGSTIKLGNLERDMQHRPFYSSTTLLHDRLKGLGDIYDVVLVDTPPALNFLTANAMVAADWVFVPVESGSKLSLLGTDDMLNFIKDARRSNPRLAFGGAILTKHDTRKTMCKIAATSVMGYYGTVLKATLPPTTDVHKAQAMGQTILQFDPDHTASRNIKEMAREIIGIAELRATSAEANNG